MFLLEHNRTEQCSFEHIRSVCAEYRRRCTWAPQLEAGKLSRVDLALCHWIASTPAEVHDSDHEGGKRMSMNNAWVKKERLHEANENNLLVVCWSS